MRPPIETPSPNHDARPAGMPVDILLLHYTGMPTGAAALARLCDPAARVSAHYLIEEDGTVYRLVPEARRAWHAGVSAWAGATDINGRSVGIELVNPGHDHGYRPFPAAQMAVLVILAHDILTRHPIPPARVLGHSDVAPDRKIDPGELFDWPGLAAAGIGLWPGPAAAVEPPGEDAALREALGRFGYGAGPEGPATAILVAAFQRHYRPAAVTGTMDAASWGRLQALLRHRDDPPVPGIAAGPPIGR